MVNSIGIVCSCNILVVQFSLCNFFVIRRAQIAPNLDEVFGSTEFSRDFILGDAQQEIYPGRIGVLSVVWK